MKPRIHTYIFIRYSVLVKSTAWSISKDKDFDRYKKKLFSEERLYFREKLFTDLTLESLKNQKTSADLDEYKVVLITSKYLPSPFIDNIETLSNKYNFLEILQIDENTGISDAINDHLEKKFRKLKQKIHYATVRLDDDDALHKNFLINLMKYINPSFSNYIISFPLGIEANYASDIKAINKCIKINYPKIAAGLAHIGSYDGENGGFQEKCNNIHQAGNHVKVDVKHPMVLDHTNITYLRLGHEHQDGGITKGKKENEIGKKELLANFSLPEDYVKLSKE